MTAGTIPRGQAETALGCSDGLDDFNSLCGLCVGEINWINVSRELKSRLVRISRLLSNLPPVKRKSFCRRQRLSTLDYSCMRKYAGIRERSPIVDCSSRARDVLLNLDDASDARIDFMKSKKGPQVGFLLHLISCYLSAIGTRAPDVIDIVDVGGGRGDLALNIATKFGSIVHVTVIEPNENASKAGRSLAIKYSLSNISFVACGIEEFEWRSLSNSKKLICSLHACGGLSDHVMSAAFSRNIPFIVVTCCFRSNNYLRLFKPIDKILGPDFERLCKLAESTVESVSQTAMHSVNSLRISAFDACKSVGIIRFPIEWSPRNQVLCSHNFLHFCLPHGCWSSST